MGYEEIQIRVTREGYVLVDTRGLPPEHVRLLSEHLQEVFGPRVELSGEPTEPSKQTINLDEDRRAEVERQSDLEVVRTEAAQERRRIRLTD